MARDEWAAAPLGRGGQPPGPFGPSQWLFPRLKILFASAMVESELAETLHQAGLSLSIVNPSRVRHFAKGLAIDTKTDPIDAKVIARFGEVVQPSYVRFLSKGQPEKLALVATMRKLLTILNTMAKTDQLWFEPAAGTQA